MKLNKGFCPCAVQQRGGQRERGLQTMMCLLACRHIMSSLSQEAISSAFTSRELKLVCEGLLPGRLSGGST